MSLEGPDEGKEKLKRAIEDSDKLDMSKVGQHIENYAKINVWTSSHQTCQGCIENCIKPNIGSSLSPKCLQSANAGRLHKHEGIMVKTASYYPVLRSSKQTFPVWVSVRVTALTQIFHPIFPTEKQRKRPEILRFQDVYGCGDRT